MPVTPFLNNAPSRSAPQYPPVELRMHVRLYASRVRFHRSPAVSWIAARGWTIVELAFRPKYPVAFWIEVTFWSPHASDMFVNHAVIDGRHVPLHKRPENTFAEVSLRTLRFVKRLLKQAAAGVYNAEL